MAIFRTQLSVTIISSKGAVVFQLCVGVHSVPTKKLFMCTELTSHMLFLIYIECHRLYVCGIQYIK